MICCSLSKESSAINIGYILKNTVTWYRDQCKICDRYVEELATRIYTFRDGKYLMALFMVCSLY